jgi:hypothetical protein
MSSFLLWIAAAPFIAASLAVTILAMFFVFALAYTIYDVLRN